MGESQFGPVVHGGDVEPDLGVLPFGLIAGEAEPVVQHPPDDTHTGDHLGHLDGAAMDVDDLVGESQARAGPLREGAEWMRFYERFWNDSLDTLENALRQEDDGE